MQQADIATTNATVSSTATSSHGRHWNQDGKHGSRNGSTDDGSLSLVHAPLPSSEPMRDQAPHSDGEAPGSSPSQRVSPPNGMARLRSSGGSPAMVPSMGRGADLEMGTHIPAPSPLRGRPVAPAAGRQAVDTPIPAYRAGSNCLGLCSPVCCSLS